MMTGPSPAEAANSEPMPLGARVDAFMSRHARAMLAVTIAAAIVLWVGGSAVVSGEVTGNITADGSIELRSGAHVKGDISTPTLAIDKGAVFDGLSRMVGAPATFGSLERRARPRDR